MPPQLFGEALEADRHARRVLRQFLLDRLGRSITVGVVVVQRVDDAAGAVVLVGDLLDRGSGDALVEHHQDALGRFGPHFSVLVDGRRWRGEDDSAAHQPERLVERRAPSHALLGPGVPIGLLKLGPDATYLDAAGIVREPRSPVLVAPNVDPLAHGAPDTFGATTGNEPPNGASDGRELRARRFLDTIGKLGEFPVRERLGHPTRRIAHHWSLEQDLLDSGSHRDHCYRVPERLSTV